MISFINKLKNKLKIWFVAILFSAIFVWWISFAANDLLWQVVHPAKNQDNLINAWENVNTVWKNFFEWSFEVWIDGNWVSGQNSPSIIVKVTRLLLTLVITLSVTMILYNGMMYIIQTWQWKEWKSLMKNIIYIVVGILISLFIVIIITLIQSVPRTISSELETERNNKTDNNAVEGESKWIRRTDIRDKILLR